jgi:predicted transcriptional regulator YdeE
MNRLLVSLLAHSLEGHTPEIVEMKVPLRAVGLSMATNAKTTYRDAPALGRGLRELKRQEPIPNLRQPWGFVAISRGFDEATQAFTYSIGDVVEGDGPVPSGMMALVIPAGTFAIFPVRPKGALGWPVAIAHAKDFAYRVWLPRSGFERAAGIDDFEYHDARSARRKDPQIDLYVGVKRPT